MSIKSPTFPTSARLEHEFRGRHGQLARNQVASTRRAPKERQQQRSFSWTRTALAIFLRSTFELPP